ncbi:MAG: S-layer homology domain-containing protein [Actinomycetia bacterium]|nr:S-layer homology domain-containing protein [Actinomycetes bacterium]
MQKRTLKVALLAVLSIVLVLGMSTVALADQTWPDLPDTVTAKYGVTDNQISAISEGYASGLWKPYQAVTRAQFTKMAVEAFNIPLVDAATASFTDVAKGSLYYQYIEGAKAAGVVNGLTATTFGPNTNITRQQALAIIARYVAQANGYDLATMYTADEVAILLAHFGDSASISADLREELAFAFDFGITVGNDYGNLAPLANLTRIQGAAMLIRAQAKVPPAQWTASRLELVSADGSENLIGQPRSVTFEVTDASGHPAIGVLVDFDVLFGGDYYVGNISPQAAVTNNYGQVTVNLLSTEVGVERVSATVAGVGTLYTTAYWLALDEVYILDTDLEAENNAGEAHDWTARVVVFGPGPRSTSALDWYNAIDAAYDPADVNVNDGVDVICEAFTGETIANDGDWTYADELDLAKIGLYPRTLAGIDVYWKIVNVREDNPATTTVDETVPSVGDIVKVDGVAVTATKAAKGVTDADGLSSISITSTATGQTKVTAVADYAGNPYPQQLYNHNTGGSDYEEHYSDWDDQPVASQAIALKTWIPHVIGGDEAGPITPTYAVNNTGEVETYVLNLKDVYGNPISGYTVEWWIQGVGFFKTDTSTWVGAGEQNKDVDVTNSAGQATLDLKSLVPGQTIVHCKVMDKYGLPYKEWNVAKQWYSIDDVSFLVWDAVNEEWLYDTGATNVVDTPHTFNVCVSGAKYVYTIYDLNKNGLRDDNVLIGNRDDMKAAAGNYANFDGTIGAAKAAGVDPAVGVPFMPATGDTWYIRFADMDMLDNEFWMDMYGTVADGPDGDRLPDDDGIDEVWAGLAGKDVYFYNNVFGDNGLQDNPLTGLVGTITSATKVVTDDLGFATVTVNSTNKGYQNVTAVADYAENPQDGDPLKPTKFAELRYDVVQKHWTPVITGPETIEIFASGILGSASGYRWTNPILEWARPGAATVTIAPPAAGTAATGVTATVTGGTAAFGGLPSGTGYTTADIGRAVTALGPVGGGATATAAIGVVGDTNNAVTAITVTAGGTGYTAAPTVVIGPPQIAGGTQATAVANINGGSVVSVTITNHGSGYTAVPTVTFTSATAPATIGTIATVVDNQVATITSAATGWADGTYPVTVPAPLKTPATATATVTDGVVTGLTFTNTGLGYFGTAPAVTISGNGTGAVAYATINADSTISLTLLSGGTGYFDIEAGDNPNREKLCVSVFDKYGNALQGYKVTFEVVGQGTTTAGTIPTYHPYAHFEDPEHDIDLTGTANDLWSGLGDLNPYLNVNPYWNRGPDLIPGNPTEELSDDDYAWGYTLNHEINFVTNPAYAATVDLVLDETRAQLAGKQHITNIVNIQVFAPDGTRVMEREVTKIWSLEAPVLTTLQVMVSTSPSGPWSTSVPATTIQPMQYRVQLFDQYGNPFTSAVSNLKLRYASAVNTWTVTLTTPDTDGVIYGAAAAPVPAGTYTFQAWNDNVTVDGLVSPTELVSNLSTYVLQ